MPNLMPLPNDAMSLKLKPSVIVMVRMLKCFVNVEQWVKMMSNIHPLLFLQWLLQGFQINVTTML